MMRLCTREYFEYFDYCNIFGNLLPVNLMTQQSFVIFAIFWSLVLSAVAKSVKEEEN